VKALGMSIRLRLPFKGPRPGALLAVLRAFAPDIKKQRVALFFAFLALAGSTAAEIFRPWPLKLIIDGVLVRKKHGAWEKGLLAQIAPTPGALLVWCAVGVILLALVSGALAYAQTLLAAGAGQRIVARIRKRLFAHLHRLELSFHEGARTGDLVMRLTGDIANLKEMLTTSLVEIGGRFMLLIGMTAIMLSIDVPMTLASLAIVPLLSFSISRISSRIRDAARQSRSKEGQLASVASESLGLVALVQAFSRADKEAERFNFGNRSSLRAGLKAAKLEAALSRSVELILAAGTGLVLFVGARRALAGIITAGDLVVFVSYLRSLHKPLRSIASHASRMAKGVACGERIVSVLEREPAIVDAPDAVPAPEFSGEIAFDGVSFGYGDGPEVLKGISFEAKPGARIALVGESGAGKSTIAKLLLRLADPRHGSVRIDGRDVREFTLESLRNRIALVPQEALLFATSIRDNIAFGRLDATDEEIVAAARLANADEFIRRLPNGYDTVVGERGITLSGGERQRIAIARAAVRNAPILVLDEPMTGLDAQSEAAVREAMERLSVGRTTLLIAHRFTLVERADLILVLEGGRVAESGTAPELRARDGVFRRLAALQSEVLG